MSRFRRQVCVAIAVVTGAAVSMAPALAASPPALTTGNQPSAPVTAGGMPTPQVDGIVFAVAIVGNTVYAGGRFTKARPFGVAPGGAGEVARHNLLAFDLDTGALLPWAPEVSGTPYSSGTNPGPFCTSTGFFAYVCDTVFRIKKSPDGSKIYVGGDFSKIGDQSRSRIAAFATSDGSLDPTFKPVADGRVRGIAVTADTVYIGGGFTSVNGVARTRLAAMGTDGALKLWTPTADGEVFAVAAAPEQGRVVVGGDFRHLNQAAHSAIGSVDATSGADAAWSARLPAGTEVVTDIVTDGNGTAYFGAYDQGGKNVRFEGRAAVDIATGVAKWFDGCYGDTQSVTVSNGVVYSGSHTHDCSAINAAPDSGPIDYYRLIGETATATRTATVNSNQVKVGDPIPDMLPWFPNTNGGPADSHWKNGPWALDSDSRYVVVGGEFSTVNGKAQQGLTRFAARGVPGAVNNGPQPFKAPVLTKNSGNPVIAWTTTWDAQNSDVTYQVYRIGTSSPIYSVTQQSRPWSTPTLSYIDRAATGGTYYVRAVDADGVSVGSPKSTI